jgi:hypothetical protein
MRYFCSLFFIKCFFPLLVNAQAEEFYGPFTSWTDIKQVYHASGDGVQDDTKALQKALDELGTGNHSPVLFIPKGTYRITATLTMQTRTCIAVIGEDPLNTIIKWDGLAGKKMFLLNGVSYSEFSRITWDGNNKALAAVAHEWDRHVPYANSGTQHSDEIFKNVAVGLKSGMNMDAEFSIRRCRFYNCSSTGISLQGWNALDWWIWDCYFENCYSGVANNLPTFGAGNFHVYRSIFNHSTFADISLGNSNFFSFRDNISYNSAKFIAASQFSNTSPITIQHNIIFNNNNEVMAELFTKGNVLFLDNTFIIPDSNRNFVIHNEDDFKGSHPDLTMIGNLFTAKQKIIQRGEGRFIDIDNKYGVAVPSLPVPKPKPFEPLAKYKVYEVNNKMTTDEIQDIINKAAATKKKAIIHFSYGVYAITKTILILPNAALIFFGDAFGTILKWSDADTGKAVLQVNYPARSVFKSIKINGGGIVDGILLYDNDKIGNTIYANELLVYGGIKSNLLINGIVNTDLRFENLQHNYCSKGISVDMIGSGKQNASILKVFGCASVENRAAYDVDKNGRIIVYDDWYENSHDSNFVTLKKSGEFILNGAKIANTNTAKAPFIDVDGFSGKVVIAEAIYNSPVKTIHFSTTDNKAQLLTMGTLNWRDSTMSCYNIQSNSNSYALINDRYNIGKGSYELPDKGNSNNDFIKEMLSDLRSTLVSDKPMFDKNATHFTLDRVMIENSINNFHIEKIQ